MVVLDVVNSLKPEVPVIDLRYGAASFVTPAYTPAVYTPGRL
jgi:hypothetical protein